MTSLKSLPFIVLSLNCLLANAETLRVGPQHVLKKPGEAAAIAKDGDTIEIEAGEYPGDSTVWRANNLIIRGIGKIRAHMSAGPKLAQDKAIWVIKGDNTTVESIEFSGAKVEDRNGAGIRQEGAGLVVKNSYFHHNQNGILSGANLQSDILVEHSEFFANGHGDGYSHNIYIGEVNSFTLRFSYSHGAYIGHQVKSRAKENYILYNLLADNADGQSSYLLDLPNGGLSLVIGNIFQQGYDTENSTFFSYGMEKELHSNSALYVTSNTFVNKKDTGFFINASRFHSAAIVANNIFAGKGRLDMGAGTRFSANISAKSFDFEARGNNLFALPKDSPAIDAGKIPESPKNVKLVPEYQYQYPTGREKRLENGALDIGAYEYTR